MVSSLRRLTKVAYQARRFHIQGTNYANLEELEAAARPLLSDQVHGYFSSGAESESTLRENRTAFARYKFLPRSLIDVSTIDTSCTLFGQRFTLPVLTAPMAMQRLCHPLGEVAMARAAANVGTAMVLSTMTTTSLEEVAATDCPALWFQLYVLTRRDITSEIIADAHALGYRALVITVDAPRMGKREADERNKFSLPPGLSLKMLDRISAGSTSQEAQEDDGSAFGRHFTKLVDDSLTWDFLRWIRSQVPTTLPVLVKGILSPDDARRAVDLGADGIVVSNHGGRQLDYTPAPLDMLPHIAAAVKGRVPLIVDGGIRRGTDVLKCIGLGAQAVMVGRPLLWALTLGGQAGVEEALKELAREVELSMALLGCRNLSEVTSDLLLQPVPQFTIPESRL